MDATEAGDCAPRDIESGNLTGIRDVSQWARAEAMAISPLDYQEEDEVCDMYLASEEHKAGCSSPGPISITSACSSPGPTSTSSVSSSLYKSFDGFMSVETKASRATTSIAQLAFARLWQFRPSFSPGRTPTTPINYQRTPKNMPQTPLAPRHSMSKSLHSHDGQLEWCKERSQRPSCLAKLCCLLSCCALRSKPCTTK